jgi:hypothetical protein
VLRVRSSSAPNLALLGAQVAELERMAFEGDANGTLRQLGQIVPAFTSLPSHSDALSLLKSR